ncbi:MAG: hypothetical protein HQL49_08830 [Gammaproteobacteria bacterium]|nr:hypothetical protein [Gammaproteobacteria bacterium]
MNRHSKTAIVIAPFLIVGGYIAADYYDNAQKAQQNIFPLEAKESCHLQQSACYLRHEKLSITLNYQQQLQISSNYPLDELAMSLIDAAGTEVRVKMYPSLNRQQWSSTHPTKEAETRRDNPLPPLPEWVRIAAIINGGYYLSELPIINDPR